MRPILKMNYKKTVVFICLFVFIDFEFNLFIKLNIANNVSNTCPFILSHFLQVYRFYLF